MLDSSSREISNMVLDLLTEESVINSDIVPFHYFENKHLKRIGPSYAENFAQNPPNRRRIVLDKSAAETALGQQIQAGTIFFAFGANVKNLIDESTIDPHLLIQYENQNLPKTYLEISLPSAPENNVGSAILVLNPVHPAGNKYFKLSDKIIKTATQIG